MVTCLGELHLWSLRHQNLIPDNDPGSFSYQEKIDGSDVSFPDEKAAYCESRDSTWVVKNKRPEKLRDNLKELEDLLQTYQCVRLQWHRRKLVQLFLSNGVVVTLEVSLHTGDVDRIFIDKSLTGRLSGDQINDVLLTTGFMLFAYADKTKLDLLYFQKRLPSPENLKKYEKLSAFDPKISQIDLPGPTSRKLDRKLVINQHKDQVLVWWSTASDEAWPWAPMTSEQERANLVLLTVAGSKIEVQCYTKTECDPIYVDFSTVQPNQVFVVEKAGVSGGESSVDICNYEYMRNKLQRASVTTIQLPSGLLSCDRTSAEDRVLLGCQDGTLVVFDEYKRLTQMTQASLVPASLRWHPSGTVVIASSSRGEVQVFDLALSPLKIQLLSESEKSSSILDLSRMFRSPTTLGNLNWCSPPDNSDDMADCVDPVLLVFDRGPVGVLRYQLGTIGQGHLIPLHLVNQYIKTRQIDEAVNLLAALNWNLDGHSCHACLSAIVNHLLRMPLNPDREAQLEAALGTFYAPAKPLSEMTILAYRDPISRLARRFFHHLLRYSRFDKAYLLAVDIGARDLFMDIHYVAKDKGELALAEVSRQKAEQIEAETIGIGTVDGYEDQVPSDEEDFVEGLAGADSEEELAPTRPPRILQQRTNRRPQPPLPAGDFQSRQSPSLPAYMESADSTLSQLEQQLSSQFSNSCYTRLLFNGRPHSGQHGQIDGINTQNEAKEDLQVIHFAVV